MLDESAIPAAVAGEPLVLTKLRWVASQPGMKELRAALRISEADGSDEPVTALARLATVYPEFPDKDFSTGGGGGSDEPLPTALVVPSWIHGTWREAATSGFVFTFSADDIVWSEVTAGVAGPQTSIKALLDGGLLTLFEHTRTTSTQFQYIYDSTEGPLYGDNFELVDGQLYFVRDQLGEDGITLSKDP
jgi:hypothetical protein